MPLFVVCHRHDPERCPAADPQTGATLLNYLSRPTVRQHGVEIRGEAVVSGEHTLYLIIESTDEDHVRQFMAPFAAAGSVEVYPASTCARVVASGGCSAPAPATDEMGPAEDAEEACQRAIDAGLVVHRAHPLNAETSIPALIGGVVMPNAHFYVRNHFQVPALDRSQWRLEVGGLVDRPLSLSLRDLETMASQTVVVTLECAGNGRSLLDRHAPGEQWGLGAVSTAEWTGVPLVEVLDRAGAASRAREVIFRGADGGFVDGRTDMVRFERSLSLDDARQSNALLAYAMNGEPLPAQHGHPLRLVVPGWYGVASVKWLTEIELVEPTFAGYFQADRYRFETEDGQQPQPVTLQRVRALITDPGADQAVEPGDLLVGGVAWSGAAPIARVELRVDERPWQDARLIGPRSRHAWQWWETTVRVESGSSTLRARATDLAGQTQPDHPDWNRLGYGANPVHEVLLRVGHLAGYVSGG
jgi:DMSO/TMAO reductase YedYZ molybdopterin-dependent catalytic subunit